MGGLELVAVDVLPAPARLGDEAGARVAGLGHVIPESVANRRPGPCTCDSGDLLACTRRVQQFESIDVVASGRSAPPWDGPAGARKSVVMGVALCVPSGCGTGFGARPP